MYDFDVRFLLFIVQNCCSCPEDSRAGGGLTVAPGPTTVALLVTCPPSCRLPLNCSVISACRRLCGRAALPQAPDPAVAQCRGITERPCHRITWLAITTGIAVLTVKVSHWRKRAMNSTGANAAPLSALSSLYMG